jgi:hypothetical protein
MKILLNGTQIWTVPIMLGLISACGLIAALLSDGVGDVVSWIALGVPITVGFCYAVRRA